MTSLYLYAIVRRRPARLPARGLHGRPLIVSRAGGASVIAERIDEAAEPTPRALAGHDRVVKRIAAATSGVLPFRFGTRVAGTSALRDLLAPAEEAVARALARVDGCVQYTLRVYGEAAPAPVSANEGPGARWLGARLRARRAPEIAPLAAATAAFVRASRAERHDRPPLVASVYHLVPRDAARAYRAALARSSRALERVEVMTTGPFPPYAFAELA
ncbi:MAG: GvpL/GvpF family gas vesicle protein [Labilithrix sp.]|nr:GvpL/GvpF family gas vesicle protein [Labilithrix sp.]